MDPVIRTRIASARMMRAMVPAISHLRRRRRYSRACKENIRTYPERPIFWTPSGKDAGRETPEELKRSRSESLKRHSSPFFSFALTFSLGLRLGMIQRFILKAQHVAQTGGSFIHEHRFHQA